MASIYLAAKFFMFELLQYQKIKNKLQKQNHKQITNSKPHLTKKRTTSDFQFQLAMEL